MCMEDYKLGRETQSGSVIVPLAGVSKIVIGESETRTCLVLGNPLANNVTYSLQNPAVSGSGLVVNVNTGPVILDLQTHGDLVKRPWFAINDAGTPSVEIMFSDLARKV